MEREPIFERSFEIKPIGYTFSVRARPSTIRGTAIRLLPWAIYAAVPHGGRMSKVALLLAKGSVAAWRPPSLSSALQSWAAK